MQFCFTYFQYKKHLWTAWVWSSGFAQFSWFLRDLNWETRARGKNTRGKFKGDVTRGDSQRRFLAQHCFQWLQHCSNIATLCCSQNRRSLKVMLPETIRWVTGFYRPLWGWEGDWVGVVSNCTMGFLRGHYHFLTGKGPTFMMPTFDHIYHNSFRFCFLI